MKMKNSTGYLILAALYITLGLVWLFGFDNTFVGIVWLVAGTVEAAITIFSYSKEKKK